VRITPQRITIALLTTLIITTIALTTATNANAHTVTKRECRTYAHLNAFVTHKPRTIRRSYRACRRAAKIHTYTHPLPNALIPDMLRRIRGCESGTGPYTTPNYKAQNTTSTASGAYQYLDTTWNGTEGYESAKDAPPRIQDERAIRDYQKGGTTPWNASSHCWG